MDQPQGTDLCAFIRKDIEMTQKLIDDDRRELQHPETLTHDVAVRLKVDLERRGKLLDSYKDALHRCLFGEPGRSSLTVCFAVADVNGWPTSAELPGPENNCATAAFTRRCTLAVSARSAATTAFSPALPWMQLGGRSVCRAREFPAISPVETAEPRATSTGAEPVPGAPFVRT